MYRVDVQLRTCIIAPKCSTRNTSATHIAPMMSTTHFIIQLAFSSEIGSLNNGRKKSSNITPHIEFNPVDIELKKVDIDSLMNYGYYNFI